MMKKSPGPASLSKRPSRRTTTRSHWLATLMRAGEDRGDKEAYDCDHPAGDVAAGAPARIGESQPQSEAG